MVPHQRATAQLFFFLQKYYTLLPHCCHSVYARVLTPISIPPTPQGGDSRMTITVSLRLARMRECVLCSLPS